MLQQSKSKSLLVATSVFLRLSMTVLFSGPQVFLTAIFAHPSWREITFARPKVKIWGIAARHYIPVWHKGGIPFLPLLHASFKAIDPEETVTNASSASGEKIRGHRFLGLQNLTGLVLIIMGLWISKIPALIFFCFFFFFKLGPSFLIFLLWSWSFLSSWDQVR